MSTLLINRLAPQSGGVLRIGGRIMFEEPLSGVNLAPANDIGAPGGQGFGVGIAPGLPTGMVAMTGTFDPASGNHGNYQYSDGSIMCWIPAFWYKFGTGANGLPVNRVAISPFSAYNNVTEAAAVGYALHRSFYDGGQIKAGFFIDKFGCSNNGGIASSIRYGLPLSSAASHNPFSGLTGTPGNNYGGAFAAAKTRGADFFPCSRYQRSALALLALAHAQAATGTAFCAWYQVGANFPKGNNNNALGDVNDGTLSFVHDGYVSGNSAKSGSANLLAKTTHNGSESGVADINGNLWDITVGMTYGTGTAGTGYYVLKTSVAMKSLTGGSGAATDAFGTAGINANYDFAGASFGYASAAGGARAHAFGNGANQVLSADSSGLDWQMAGLGLAMATGASAAGTAEFGNDFMYDSGPSPAELCPLSGGNWGSGSLSGAWALNLGSVRANSDVVVGFRAGLYQ